VDKVGYNLKRIDMKVLNREEMKMVMAGNEECCEGNIKCNVLGNEYYCNLPTLEECLDDCSGHWTCQGCAQFPAQELN